MSLVFFSPLGGYTLAACLNNRIHAKLGRRGVAWLSPGCHIIAYIVNCLHPPYPVLVVSFIFAGFGNGLSDAAWNAWLGNMANANQLLGLLHGFYGAGGVLSPLIATSLITKAHLEWYYFYYIMVRKSLANCQTITNISRLAARRSNSRSFSRLSGIRPVHLSKTLAPMKAKVVSVKFSLRKRMPG